MMASGKLLARAVDTLSAAWAFIDIAIVVAIPFAVALLAWRGRPLWKSHLLVALPYMVYATLAGRMPYLTAYIVISACLVPIWAVGLDMGRCKSFWQAWGIAVVSLAVAPALVFAFVRGVRRYVSRA